MIDPYRAYLRERVAAWPELSGARLLREMRDAGLRRRHHRAQRLPAQRAAAAGGAVRGALRDAGGPSGAGGLRRTSGSSSTTQPGVRAPVWLFAMVLGHSRYLWAQFVLHQDLGTVLRCHMEAFEHFGGVPREILYDRMKTAVLGEPEADQPIVYNAKLLALGAHYGFAPRACQPYRAKTKGKVERPYRYIRADFFLARRFANLEDMNRQLRAVARHGGQRAPCTAPPSGSWPSTSPRSAPSLQRAAGRPLRCRAAHRAARQPRGLRHGRRQPATACPTARAAACSRSRPPPTRCASTRTGAAHCRARRCCTDAASARCCRGIGSCAAAQRTRARPARRVVRARPQRGAPPAGDLRACQRARMLRRARDERGTAATPPNASAVTWWA